MTSNKITLFLVDDHSVVRTGIKALLSSQDNLDIIGEVNNGTDAVKKIAELEPDIAILDISMPDKNGIEVLKELKELESKTRFIALSMHEDPEYVQSFLAAGGSGYVPKSSLETQLIDAVHAVSRGEYFAPANLLAQVAQEMASPDPYKNVQLTDREHEVVKKIAEGSTYKEIGAELGISEKTVATYRERAADKLGLNSRADLVRWALKNNLLE